MSKKTSARIGCAYFLAGTLILIAQIIFLTLKISGAMSWSWWVAFSPSLVYIGIHIAALVTAFAILLPREVIRSLKKRKRIDKEAESYGMERQPGESDGDLKKRIVRRNMIAGNYSRKEIKDIILDTFPTVASCQFEIDNENHEIKMRVRRAPEENRNGWIVTEFTNEELREILDKAADYIPPAYAVTIEQIKEGAENGKE